LAREETERDIKKQWLIPSARKNQMPKYHHENNQMPERAFSSGIPDVSLYFRRRPSSQMASIAEKGKNREREREMKREREREREKITERE
jgi:hypothetical protein